MRLDAITLEHFRNYAHQSVTFDPSVNVIVGEESIALKADEAGRLDGFAGEVKLCSKSGAKLMLAKAKAV